MRSVPHVLLSTLARAARWLAASKYAVPAIFILALALRLAVIGLFPITPIHDSQWYLGRGREIAGGMGFQENGHPTAFWPVGYPALIGFATFVCGPSLFGPILFNLVAQAATLALILWFARALTGDETAARLAALLYAIYPAHIIYTGDTAAEATSTAVTMAGMALVVAARGRIAMTFLAGVTLGLATLMRPQVLLLPPVLLVLMAIGLDGFGWRRMLRSGAIVACGMMLTILPWTARNVAVLGAPVLVSTNGGVALQAGANDLADGGYFQVEKSPLWAEVGIPFTERVVRQVEIDARLKAMAKRWIAAHPGRWLMLGVRKVAILWAKDTEGFWSLEASYPQLGTIWTAGQVLNELYYLAVMATGLAGFALAARATWRRQSEAAPLVVAAAMPLFCTVLAFGFTGQTRYHYPAMPFMMIASAWLVIYTLRAWRRRRSARTLIERRDAPIRAV